MKNKILIVLLVVLLIGLLIFVSQYINKETQKVLNTSISSTSGESLNLEKTSGESGNTFLDQNEIDNTVQSSNIISEEDFESLVLKNEQKVLVDFYADWCEPCNQLSPILDEVLAKHPEIAYYKVNVDEQEPLCSRYRIYYIPTLIVFFNGEETGRSTGLIDGFQVEELIK